MNEKAPTALSFRHQRVKRLRLRIVSVCGSQIFLNTFDVILIFFGLRNTKTKNHFRSQRKQVEGGSKTLSTHVPPRPTVPPSDRTGPELNHGYIIVCYLYKQCWELKENIHHDVVHSVQIQSASGIQRRNASDPRTYHPFKMVSSRQAKLRSSMQES